MCVVVNRTTRCLRSATLFAPRRQLRLPPSRRSEREVGLACLPQESIATRHPASLVQMSSMVVMPTIARMCFHSFQRRIMLTAPFMRDVMLDFCTWSRMTRVSLHRCFTCHHVMVPMQPVMVVVQLMNFNTIM